jgi:hypothetical protein
MQVARIAKLKEEQKEKEYYNRYISVYYAALQYLKNHNVIMHGGTALNEYLPAKFKIYDKHTLPDIDVLSSDGPVLAKKLVDHLHKNGYTNGTYVGKALHHGTYTIFSEGLKLVDITYTTPALMKNLKGVVVDTLQLVSPIFLQLTLHGMLAIESVERWGKASERLPVFYKVYPPKPPPISSVMVELAPLLDKVNTDIHAYIEDSDCVILGTPTISLMLGKNIDAFKGVPFNIGIVNEDPVEYAKALAKALPAYELTVSKLHSEIGVLFQTSHVVIYYKKNAVCLIYQAKPFCFNYTEYKGFKIGTINTVMTMYLGMYLSIEPHLQKCKPVLKTVIDNLAALFLKKTPSHIFKPVTLTCVGKQDGVVTLRRKRFTK